MLDDRGWERDELSVYQGREEVADGAADWAEHSVHLRSRRSVRRTRRILRGLLRIEVLNVKVHVF